MANRHPSRYCTMSEGDNHCKPNSRIHQMPIRKGEKEVAKKYRKTMPESKLPEPERKIGQFKLKRGSYRNDCWLPYTRTHNATQQGHATDMNLVIHSLVIYKHQLACDARLKTFNETDEESDRVLLEKLSKEVTSAKQS